MNKFFEYQNLLNHNNTHKIKKSNHILNLEDYQTFEGFTAQEIWGECCDYDYENWLKEQ